MSTSALRARQHRRWQTVSRSLEFDRYDSDEARFLEAYPAAKRGVTPLLKAINEARVARGESIERPKRSLIRLPRNPTAV